MLTGRRNIVVSAKPKKASANVVPNPAAIEAKVVRKRGAAAIVSKAPRIVAPPPGPDVDHQTLYDAADAMWRKVSAHGGDAVTQSRSNGSRIIHCST